MYEYFSRMIQAILFDLDDLMVNSAPFHMEASKRVFDRFGINIDEIPADVIKTYFGRRVSEIIEDIISHFNLDSKVDLNRIIQEREDLFLQMVKARLEPMPGLFELIETIKSLEIRRAVASSGTKKYVNAVLDKFGLQDFFEAIISGDMVTKGKPDPEVFLKAAAVLGVDPATCLVLEDATHGVAAAKAAGMYCIGVDNQLSSYKQDLSKSDKVIKRLDEIDLNLLKQFG
jgi:HAD superfamily hydrolase (TIGR01509 family)